MPSIETLQEELRQLKSRLEVVEKDIASLQTDVKSQILINKQQNKKIRGLIQHNGSSIRSLTYLLGGGLVFLIFMTGRIDTRTPEGMQAYNQTQDRLMELIGIAAASAGGGLAIWEDRKNRSEEESEEE